MSTPARDDSGVFSGWSWLGVIGLVYLLLVAVSLISTGFRLVLADQAIALFALATNPFLGLIVGIVTTALIQSSSVTTSIVVGLVAGGLPVVTAVPLIMGANIGTSVTNTLVSLGYVGDKAAFQRAFAAATVLDMFNILAVIIFLPLEIALHGLEHLSLWLGEPLVGSSSLAAFNPVVAITQPVTDLVARVVATIPPPWGLILQISLGLVLLFATLQVLSQQLKHLLIGTAKAMLDNVLGRGALANIAAGAVITLLVQSSSTTTSLLVPLASTGALSLREIYPFTLGANIGTCITALLAATAIRGNTALPALEIALVHLLFNGLGVLLIFGLPWLRALPVNLANYLATRTSEHRVIALVYVGGVFFGLPLFCLGLSLRF